MTLNEYIIEIENFLKEYKENSHTNGYVLGLSGGIDSALAAVITQKAVGNDNLYCVLMPCHSHPSDLEDALELVRKFNLNYSIVDLTSSFDEIYSKIDEKVKLEGLSIHNIKVRLRMVTLFAIAQARNSLVIGTDNWDENFVGYFTKYGDGAADVLPLVRLTKGEVYEASKLLGVTDKILNKAPTAGLFEDQTDEKEMGIKYVDLDSYLLGKEIDTELKLKIERLHRISNHKRVEIPRPKEFVRN